MDLSLRIRAWWGRDHRDRLNFLYRSPLYGVGRMPSAAIGPYRAKNVPVLDIHEIVAGKMVALITRRTARDLFDAYRIITLANLDLTKISILPAGAALFGSAMTWMLCSYIVHMSTASSAACPR